MASTSCFFARVPLLALPPLLSIACRLRHGAARSSHRAVAAARPARRLPGSVRTEGEFGGAGHPAGAVNIPYMYSTGSGMAKNTQFVEQVSAIFGRDAEIIIGCQSGRRSLMAAAELCSAGFTALTDIAGGFAAWRENGLPVNQ